MNEARVDGDAQGRREERHSTCVEYGKGRPGTKLWPARMLGDGHVGHRHGGSTLAGKQDPCLRAPLQVQLGLGYVACLSGWRYGPRTEPYKGDSGGCLWLASKHTSWETLHCVRPGCIGGIHGAGSLHTRGGPVLRGERHSGG